MNRLQKIFTTVIIAALLTACGTAPSDDRGKTVDTPASSFDTQTTQNTETSNGTADNLEEAAADSSEQKDASFEEITVIDNSECIIKITGIDPDNLWGYTLNAYLENKSADKTYMYSVTNASINGVECDPFFATEVAAGKKSNSEINFSTSTLEENGITDFTDIEISFRVYDSNDWMADAVAEQTTHVYPYGVENAVSFERQIQSTDEILIDNEYVTVTITGYKEDEIWGYTANLYLVNKTDADIMFSVDESSINGYMVEPFYAETVAAGKSTLSSISWSNEDLEENGITDVTQIELNFRAYDANNWMAEDFANEHIILNPKS